MQLGMIGLGRMGSNMVRRLMQGGHECVVWDVSTSAVEAVAKEGARAAASLEDLVASLDTPRAVWIMIPAALVDDTLKQLAPLLSSGDLVVDGGNSHYQKDIDRAAALSKQGIAYLDAGVSGGVHGLERGYCLMVGGPEEAFDHLEPVFRTLAPGVGAAPRSRGRSAAVHQEEHGYLHCGPSGSGHFVKMVHNGIEYGLMAAYAEGFNLLAHAGIGREDREKNAETAPLDQPQYYQFDIPVDKVAELWRRGSVIPSWLLDLTAEALHASPELKAFSEKVADSGEGRWTVQAGVDTGTPTPVLTAALYSRFASRGEDGFAGKVLSAMRKGFGGH